MKITELIDTCWDVNLSVEEVKRIDNYRINRYMLGCKLKKLVANVCLHKELIDTCWDVNLLYSGSIFFASSELIDTCWDVNAKQRPRIGVSEMN